MSSSNNNQPYVVAIGASAGGLEALQDFLGHLPPSLNNLCIIIAQHLSPTHKSMLVQLLSRGTQLQVTEAVNGSSLIGNNVYITPPDKEITLVNGCIHLQKPEFAAGPKPSVDVLFQSLAQELKKRVIAIILSGTGSDGAQGVKLIKKAGGFVIAQEPNTSKYDGMPLAAIETGNVDLILPPDKMGEAISHFLENPQKLLRRISANEENATTLDKIFKLLSKRTGTDFANYKPSTICRRLEKRLSMLQMQSIEEYLPFVEKNPKELDIMFNMILIGVTAFFRDLSAFKALEKQLQVILEQKGDKAPIRIWIPGCSTGEEAYSIAILLSKMLKEKALLHNIQIFATDIDEKAIAFARRGLYQENSLEDVPKDIIETYFLKKGRDYELVKSIRMMVLFSKHDVTKNPPFLKLDLITCRNLLIYFGANLQKQIIPVFHYALNPNGYLFLGKSETIGQFSDLFSTMDERAKIYQRKAVGNIHGIKFSAFRTQKPELVAKESRGSALLKVTSKKEPTLSDWVKETLFQYFEHPYVIINDAFDIQEINGDVRLFLTFSTGIVNVNLLRMVNAELHIELRSIITKAIKEQTLIKSTIRKFEVFEHVYYVRLSCLPLNIKEGADNLYVVVFEKMDLSELQHKGLISLEPSTNDEKLQELEHELAATKEHLQTYIEELETSNEELQSLNEEMQSTNEELQSSNEELETSNEELQSTNEEIQVAYAELKNVNEQLEKKEKELRENDANLNAMLNNDLQAFILVNENYSIISYNNKAKEIISEIANKKLKPKTSVIDYIAMPQLEEFLTDFKKSLKGETLNREITMHSPKHFPRSYIFNFSPVVNTADNITIVSVGILETTTLKEALSNLNATQELLSSVFEATSIGICITDAKGAFVNMNQQYCHIYGYTKEELLGQNFTMMVPVSNRENAQKQHDLFIEKGVEIPAEWQVQRKNGSIIDIFVTAELLVQPDGNRLKVTSIRDITESNKYKKLLIQTQETAVVGGWEFDIPSGEMYITEEVNKLFEAYNKTLTEADILAFFNEREAEELTFLLDEAKENGVPFSVTMEATTLLGNARVIKINCKTSNVAGKVSKLFGVFQDVTQQKKIEDNLRKLSMAVEQSASSILITNLKGEIEYVNPAFCDITGYTFSEVVGKNPRILKSGYTSGDEYSLLWKRLSEGKSWMGTFCNKKKSGELFWESANVSPVFDKGGVITHFVAVKENITQQKVAEKERDILYTIINIFNETNELHTAFEKLLNVVCHYLKFVYSEAWMVNIDSSKLVYQANYNAGRKRIQPSNGTIAIHQLHENGIIEKAFLQKNILKGANADCLLSLGSGKIQGNINSCFAVPILNQNEVVAVCTFYSEVETAYYNDFPALLQKIMLEIGGYIVKRKKEQELNQFFSLAPNMLCITGKDGFFKKVNPAFEKVLGFTEKELLAKPIHTFLHPEDVAEHQLLQQLDSDREVTGYQNRYISKAGSVKWLSWKRVAADKEVFYEVANDITQEFQLNEERKELISELLRSNQELKQFSYITSHNMRSPITNMLAIFQLLNKNNLPDTETKELFDALEKSTFRLNETLNDLIKILIIKENSDLELTVVRFDDVFTHVLQSIDHIVGKATVIKDFSACPAVEFNEGYMESVFLNLLTNALKYAHPERGAYIEVVSEYQEDRCVLKVKDNGLGMNMDRIKGKIFGLHQRFHGNINSSGMGLYIIKSQIEALGGTIDVESEESVGSVFEVHFKPAPQLYI